MYGDVNGVGEYYVWKKIITNSEGMPELVDSDIQLQIRDDLIIDFSQVEFINIENAIHAVRSEEYGVMQSDVAGCTLVKVTREILGNPLIPD